jgi:hypothetical protein
MNIERKAPGFIEGRIEYAYTSLVYTKDFPRLNMMTENFNVNNYIRMHTDDR